MIRFVPTGTFVDIKLGLKKVKTTRIRGRFGDGARERSFESDEAVLDCLWADRNLDAKLLVTEESFVREVALHLHYRSPRLPGETVISMEPYSGSPSELETSGQWDRNGAWAMWMAEDSLSDGVFFGVGPNAEQPVFFRCRPRKNRLSITWKVGRTVKPGESLSLATLIRDKGKGLPLLLSWKRPWAGVSVRTAAQEMRQGWEAGSEIKSVNDLREILGVLRSRKMAPGWYALGPNYAAAAGDWLTPSEAFHDRMGGAARAIVEQNMVPGLRFAPFLVSKKSTQASEHPEWLVRSPKGKPVTVSGYGKDDDAYVLDVTHPEVPKHVHKIFTIMRDRWGFRAFVAERLSDAAVIGVRQDDSQGIGTLSRKAAEILRSAVGPRVFLMASDQPFLFGPKAWDAVRSAPSISYFPPGKQKNVFSDITETMLHASGWNEEFRTNASTPLPISSFSYGNASAESTAHHAAALSCGLSVLSGDPRNLDDAAYLRVRNYLRLFEECRRGRLVLSTPFQKSRHPLVVRNSRGRIAVFNFSKKKVSVALEREELKSHLGSAATISAGDGAVFNSPEIHVVLPPRGHRVFRG